MGHLANTESDSSRRDDISEAAQNYLAVETIVSDSQLTFENDVTVSEQRVGVPNERSQQALQQMRSGELNEYASLDELREELGA